MTPSRLLKPGGRRALLAAPLLTAAAVALVFALSASGLGQLLEWRSVDLRFKLRGPRSPCPQILIVALDERSFDDLKLKYPFPPILFARLIERLHAQGAVVVAFDLLHSEPTRECDPPGQDALLAEAMRRGGPVVWAAQIRQGGRFDEPIRVIRDAAARVGFINWPDERDGRVRRFLPESAGHPCFAAAVLEAYAGFLPPACQGGGLRLIDFRGGAGTFEPVSLSAVLAGSVPKEKIAGKICLVGPTFAASHDLFATPFHRIDRPDMPGIEVHANILADLLEGRALAASPPALCWLVVFALSLLVAVLMTWGFPWWSLSLWAAVSAGWCAVAVERFLHGQVLLVVGPLGALAATFWSIAFFSYLAERRKRLEIRTLFAHYVDPTVVDWLIRHPEAVKTAGERRRVTILTTDIEAFTTITEHTEAALLVDHLNAYFATVTQAILDSGGMHDKFVGDAVVAIFGFPLEQPDHALRAVMAAHEILARLERLAPDWEREGKPVFRTRIGISTGEVVVGNVGGPKRKAITAMGDAANLSSRLEALNKRFGTHVLLDEATANLLPRDIPLKELGEVEVRGMARPVRVFNPAFDVPGLAAGSRRQAEGEAHVP